MKKPKELNQRLSTLKGMLEYHRGNEGKRTLIAKLEKEIDFIETQEAAKQREVKLSNKAYLEEMALNKEEGAFSPYKVVTEKKNVVFYGTLKKCSLFFKENKDFDLLIKRNN